ncbi:MAG TPA: ABC transporter permease [Actinomycetota bacterium]|nr:ABC transporter permease [Actinomycetota bacterium]
MSTVVTPPPIHVPLEAPPTEPAPLREKRRKPSRFLLPAYTALLMLYLVTPILMMILYGFNDIPGERQTPRFWGFTLDWYRNAFSDPSLNQAVRNSIMIAIVAAAIATPLGTTLGLALGRYGFRGKAAVSFLIFMGIAIPEIVLGSSLLSMYVQVQAPLGLLTILLSHIAFDTPFVAVVVRARVQGMDRSLEDAAQDLFATPLVAFRKVTLPIILPGIMSGFMLAFVLSLDDFVITNFVSGQVRTLPIWVYGATKVGLPPLVNVFGTLLFVAGLVLALLSVLSQRKEA